MKLSKRFPLHVLGNLAYSMNSDVVPTGTVRLMTSRLLKEVYVLHFKIRELQFIYISIACFFSPNIDKAWYILVDRVKAAGSVENDA